MDFPIGMKVAQSIQDIVCEPGQIGLRFSDILRQVAAIAELHDNERIPLEITRIRRMDQIPAGYPAGTIFHVKPFDERLADGGRDFPETQQFKRPWDTGCIGYLENNAERAFPEDFLNPILGIDQITEMTVIAFWNNDMPGWVVRHLFWNLYVRFPMRMISPDRMKMVSESGLSIGMRHPS